VFSLIGPKRYDAPWKDIESQGSIAPAECTEVRVTLTDAERMAYAGVRVTPTPPYRGGGVDCWAGLGQPCWDRLSLVLAADLMS
jgi:hypothetical protein